MTKLLFKSLALKALFFFSICFGPGWMYGEGKSLGLHPERGIVCACACAENSARVPFAASKLGRRETEIIDGFTEHQRWRRGAEPKNGKKGRKREKKT